MIIQKSSEFSAGDWVEVRSREEILQTLDNRGRLDELPFMPEMFAYCSQRFRVANRAHKTCDPPNGMQGRRMVRAVHLEDVRCNGADHGGCEARCLIFWKDAWLKPVESSQPVRATNVNAGCDEATVLMNTRRQPDSVNTEEITYFCQSTEVRAATEPIRWWDMRQYVEDYLSGNVSIGRIISTFLFFLYDQVVSAGLGLGSGMRWIYDAVQKFRGAPPYPHRVGKIPQGAKTPTEKLNLAPGELVQIRSYGEILETLNESNYNRGMSFDAELTRFCGGVYRVLARVDKIIDEKTGKMQKMKNDCIMLDKVVCQACYAKHRRFCPRAIYPYWREIWLRRVSPAPKSEAPESELTSARC